MYPGTDPWAETEALETGRLDADLEMAEMAACGDAIRAARRRGVCCHQSAAGYGNPPACPEQEGLRPGQVRCADGCGRVFASEEDWETAVDEAVNGP